MARLAPRRVALTALARFLAEPAGKVLLALIGEAQHDPEMARTFHQRYLDPRRAAEREMLSRGTASGEPRDHAGPGAGGSAEGICRDSRRVGDILYRHNQSDRQF